MPNEPDWRCASTNKRCLSIEVLIDRAGDLGEEIGRILVAQPVGLVEEAGMDVYLAGQIVVLVGQGRPALGAEPSLGSAKQPPTARARISIP